MKMRGDVFLSVREAVKMGVLERMLGRQHFFGQKVKPNISSLSPMRTGCRDHCGICSLPEYHLHKTGGIFDPPQDNFPDRVENEFRLHVIRHPRRKDHSARYVPYLTQVLESLVCPNVADVARYHLKRPVDFHSPHKIRIAVSARRAAVRERSLPPPHVNRSRVPDSTCTPALSGTTPPLSSNTRRTRSA